LLLNPDLPSAGYGTEIGLLRADELQSPRWRGNAWRCAKVA
jgi:hypothetical protein